MTNNIPRFSLSRDDIKNYWFPKVILPLLVFISLIISIWSMVLSHASIDNNPLEFSYEALGTIIGIILSAVALVISLYFIILGISANSIRREIKNDVDNAKTDVENARIDIKKYSEEANKQCSITAQTIYDGYSEAIAMIREFYSSTFVNLPNHHSNSRQIEELGKQIIKLKLAECRFAINAESLDIAKRVSAINLIKELSTDENDLLLLKEVVNKTSDQAIKEVAQYAYDELMNKLNPNP